MAPMRSVQDQDAGENGPTMLIEVLSYSNPNSTLLIIMTDKI